jgi:hypothetical protein
LTVDTRITMTPQECEAVAARLIEAVEGDWRFRNIVVRRLCALVPRAALNALVDELVPYSELEHKGEEGS